MGISNQINRNMLSSAEDKILNITCWNLKDFLPAGLTRNPVTKIEKIGQTLDVLDWTTCHVDPVSM